MSVNWKDVEGWRIPTLLLSLGLFAGAAWVAWQQGEPVDYAGPAGTVYAIPAELTPGGWTAATVKDIDKDRRSFRAYVPLTDAPSEPDSSQNTEAATDQPQSGTTGTARPPAGDTTTDTGATTGQETLVSGTSGQNTSGPAATSAPQSKVFPLIKVFDGTAGSLQEVIQTQTSVGNRWNHSGNVPIHFVLRHNSLPNDGEDMKEPLNQPLDSSLVPGSVVMVNFSCRFGNGAGQDLPGEPTQQDCLKVPGQQFGTNGTPLAVRYYVRQLGVVSVQPTFAQRLGVLLLVALAFYLLLLAVLWNRRPYGLKYMMVGKDNRYSNSQFQTVLWFSTLVVALFTTQIIRVAQGGPLLAGWVSIPVNLVALSGLSALTFVGAAAITDGNVKSGRILKASAKRPRFPYDLFHNDAGQFDLADFQSMLVSVMAAVAYVVILLGYLGSINLKQEWLPDVNSTILAIFGLGQGTYLAKKALLISEYGGVAFTVSPDPKTHLQTDIQNTPNLALATVTVTWDEQLQGRTMRLRVLDGELPHNHFKVVPEAFQMAPPNTRQDVEVQAMNAATLPVGTYAVKIEGVVSDVIRTADVTIVVS